MSQGSVLHLFSWDKKFFPPFRDFIHKHFADSEHHFIVHGDVDAELASDADVVVYPSLLKNSIALTKAMHRADKVILHGLFSNHLLYLLAVQPWLLKKCYWVIWGGDLYIHESQKKDWRWEKNEFFRRFVVKRLGHFVTYIKGDFELAKKWYGAKGQYHHCLMYPSNLYKEKILPPKQGGAVKILVGNSADSTNNHEEVFEMLNAYKYEKIQIFCPLSYGPYYNAERIAKHGKELFEDKFIPLLDFMAFDNYMELLGEIDIAVFAHERQQGMGNMISLLGFGKKVYMRSDVTPWTMFDKLGVIVFDVRKIDLIPINDDVCKNNKARIKSHFSESELVKQLHNIFRD